MLADPTGKLTRDFDVMIEEDGMALRGTFVVNPDGEIKAYEVHDNGIGRNAEELLKKSSSCNNLLQNMVIKFAQLNLNSRSRNTSTKLRFSRKIIRNIKMNSIYRVHFLCTKY